MQESFQSSLFKRKEVLGIFCLLFVVVIVFGFAVWRIADHVDELEARLDKSNTGDTSTSADTDKPANLVTIESGKKGFSMMVPESFGTLINDTNGDFVILPGMEQPMQHGSTKQTVKGMKGYGSDSASVFIVMLSEDGMGDTPQGTSEEFTIGKGDDALVGKKYSYVYPKDEIVGIGYPRYQNDREYRYAFTTKDGKKLDIIYNVYGVDPRNLASTVDGIVRSIVVK